MPIRRCAVCRKEADKNRLVRVVWVEGGAQPDQLKLDLEGTAPGRGAYLHLQSGCLLRRGAAESVVASLVRYDKRQIEQRLKKLTVLGPVGEAIEKLLLEIAQNSEKRRADGVESAAKRERQQLLGELCAAVERAAIARLAGREGQKDSGGKPDSVLMKGVLAKKRRVLL